MPRTILVFFLVLAIVSTAFLAVWQRNEMIRVGYETESLQRRRKVLLRLKKELVAEIASLSAVARIEAIALEQLQMKPPDPKQRVMIATRETHETNNSAE